MKKAWILQYIIESKIQIWKWKFADKVAWNQLGKKPLEQVPVFHWVNILGIGFYSVYDMITNFPTVTTPCFLGFFFSVVYLGYLISEIE